MPLTTILIERGSSPMKRILLASAAAGPLVATTNINPVSYYRDVVPILQEHCLSCHRPGQVAPISFTSYRQTRRWAEEIRHVVTAGKMPSWSVGGPKWKDHILSIRDAGTLIRWVDQGALEGDPNDAPFPAYVEEARLGWQETVAPTGLTMISAPPGNVGINEWWSSPARQTTKGE
jgi:hypothetical protein